MPILASRSFSTGNLHGVPTQLVLGRGHAAWQEGRGLRMITICRYHLIYPRWSNPIITCALTLKAVSSKHKMLSTQDIKFRATGKSPALISARSCCTMVVRFDNVGNTTWRPLWHGHPCWTTINWFHVGMKKSNVLQHDRSMWGAARLMPKHWMKSSCRRFQCWQCLNRFIGCFYIPRYMVFCMSDFLSNS